MKYLILLIIILLCSCENDSYRDSKQFDLFESQNCILNGDVVENMYFGNFIVGLGMEKNGFAQCTGILISPRVVLTAGHCGGKETDLDVFIGPDSKNPYEIIAVSKVVRHPDVDLGLWLLEYESGYTGFYSKFSSIEEYEFISVFGYGTEKELYENKGLLRVGIGVTFETDSKNLLHYRVACGAATEGGDSGGPIFDVKGNLVAIHLGVVYRETYQEALGVVVEPYLEWIFKEYQQLTKEE